MRFQWALAHRLFVAAFFVFVAPASADTTKGDVHFKAPRIVDGSRIVSVGGSVTEIIFALDLQDQIVAVDTTSQYPDSASSRPNVGYMRRLSAEPILALAPSVVLAVDDAGPHTTLDQLREAGVLVVTIPDDPTPKGAVAKINHVARLLGAPDAGRILAARLEEDLHVLEMTLAGVKARPKVLFLLSVGSGRPPLAAGANTAAAGIIALAGGANAINAYDGYKPLSPEALVAAAPDVILVTERSLKMLGGLNGIATIPEIRQTPAGKSGRIVAMNGLLLLGFGPRTGSAARDLAQTLHPNLRFTADAR